MQTCRVFAQIVTYIFKFLQNPTFYQAVTTMAVFNEVNCSLNLILPEQLKQINNQWFIDTSIIISIEGKYEHMW